MNRMLLTLLILFVSDLAIGQVPILFHESKRENFEVKMTNGGDASQQVANWMIKEMSLGMHHQPGNRSYIFAFEQAIRLTRENNKLLAVVELSKFLTEGFNNYKGFDMTEALIPAKVQIFGKYVASPSKQVSVQSDLVPLNPEKTKFSFEMPDTLTGQQIKFIVNEKKFIFDQVNRSRFNDRIRLINEYYDADAQLISMIRDLHQIDPDDAELVFKNDETIKQMQGFMMDLNRRDFDRRLNLEFNDPVELKRRLRETSNRLQQKSDRIAETIAHLHEIWFERGLSLRRLGNRSAAREMFNRSLQVNNQFAPAVYQLALLELEEGYTDESAKLLTGLFRLPYIDAETKNMSIELAYELMSFQIKEADALILQYKYQDAISVLNSTSSFCNSIREVICDDRIYRSLGRAHNAYYSQIISEGQDMIDRRSYDNAENLAREAMEYQRVQSEWVQDNSKAQSLLNQAKNGQYQQNVAEGIRRLEQKQYQNAFDALDKAWRIENEYAVQKDSRLWGKLREAKKPLLSSDMERASQLVASNNLPGANQIVSRVSEDVNYYEFSNDKAIMQRLNDLRNSIMSRHCQNVQQEFESYFRQANDQIMQLRFVDAENIFTKAFNLASTNSECMIDISKAQQRRNEVLPAISYQSLINETESLIGRNRNVDAVNKYMEAQSYFNRFSVEKYRLSHLHIADYAKQKTTNFMLQVSQTLCNENDLANSLSLLNQLEIRKINKKLTRSLQESLGYKLAIRDRQNGITTKPKTQVLQYTQDKSYYKYLRKAYLKQMK